MIDKIYSDIQWHICGVVLTATRSPTYPGMMDTKRLAKGCQKKTHSQSQAPTKTTTTTTTTIARATATPTNQPTSQPTNQSTNLPNKQASKPLTTRTNITTQNIQIKLTSINLGLSGKCEGCLQSKKTIWGYWQSADQPANHWIGSFTRPQSRSVRANPFKPLGSFPQGFPSGFNNHWS